jgi:hypothetical protein
MLRVQLPFILNGIKMSSLLAYYMGLGDSLATIFWRFASGNYVVGSTSVVFNTNNFKVETRFRLTDVNTSQLAFSQDGPDLYNTAGLVRIGIVSGKVHLLVRGKITNSTHYTIEAPTPINTGRWYTVIGERVGNTYAIYVDGIKEKESVLPALDIVNSQKPTLGAYSANPAQSTIKGDIAYTEIWINGVKVRHFIPTLAGNGVSDSTGNDGATDKSGATVMQE